MTESRSTKLGFLDLGFFSVKKEHPLSTIKETIYTVVELDKLGFSRFWLGEHHNSNIAWRSPDILVPILASYTKKINIGVAGVLMRYHNPHLTAQNYKLLSNLFGNRIDLGFSKGKVSDFLASRLLGYGEDSLDNFINRTSEVIDILREDRKENVPLVGLKHNPNLWLLGGSAASIDFAIKYQMNICISLCHRKRDKKELSKLRDKLRVYKRQLLNQNLQASILITLLCNEDDTFSEHVCEDRVFGGVELNHSGNFESCKNYVDSLVHYFDVDEIVLGNIYRDKGDKMNTLRAFSKNV